MSEQDKATLKVAHIATPTSGMNLALLKFKELVDRDSSPSLKIEIYPNGEKGGEVEMVDQVRENSIQAVLISTAVMSNYAPALAAVTLPYLFRDRDSVLSFLASGVSREILRSLEDASLVGLGYCYNNFFNLLLGRRSGITEIKHPDDIHGQLFRSGQSDVWSKMIKALGFTPKAMPFPRMADALETGEVEGCDSIISLMDELNYEKFIKSITLTRHWIGLPVFSINRNYFDGLGPENQAVVRNAAQSAFQSHVESGVADRENEQAIASFRKKGVKAIELNDDVLDLFVRRTRVVHEMYEDIIGKDLLSEIYKACNYTANKVDPVTI